MTHTRCWLAAAGFSGLSLACSGAGQLCTQVDKAQCKGTNRCTRTLACLLPASQHMNITGNRTVQRLS